MYKVGIITASDKGAKGEREDISGKVIQTIMLEYGYLVSAYVIVPDDRKALKETMVRMSDDIKVDLILTTGGTGLSPRDITPEATLDIIHREVPGIPEAIRSFSMKITDRAMLSRAKAGIRNRTLIINLPGSPKAVKESLLYIIDTLKHGLDILCENDSECATPMKP